MSGVEMWSITMDSPLKHNPTCIFMLSQEKDFALHVESFHAQQMYVCTCTVHVLYMHVYMRREMLFEFSKNVQCMCCIIPVDGYLANVLIFSDLFQSSNK